MPRARSPDSIEAEKLYKSGMALVDIAKKLGKPEGTVRRWKSTQKWDENGKKKQGERSQKKNASEKASVRKRGGQPGNQNCKGKQNAKGHGAPKGTQNALKHGGYSAVYWDTLDEDEKELIETMPQDEEEILINQIMLFTVRERRIMKAINKYREAKGGVYVAGVTKFEEKRTFKDDAERELYENRVRVVIIWFKPFPRYPLQRTQRCGQFIVHVCFPPFSSLLQYISHKSGDKEPGRSSFWDPRI